MNYTTGQIIRTLPEKDGSFSFYKIEGFQLDLIEAREIGFISGHETLAEKTDFLHPDLVELYEYECNVGSYRLGDTVRLFGIEGTWTVLSLYEATDCARTALQAACEDEFGRRIYISAHYVKKA